MAGDMWSIARLVLYCGMGSIVIVCNGAMCGMLATVLAREAAARLKARRRSRPRPHHAIEGRARAILCVSDDGTIQWLDVTKSQV